MEDAARLRRNVPGLESAARSLTREEIVRFVEVVRLSAADDHIWPPDERFGFDGTAGVTLSTGEMDVLSELGTRMNAALVFAVTGEEVEAWIDRPGLLAHLDRIGSRSHQIEGRAATILERTLGGQVWLGTIGIWNALIAALFKDRLEAALYEDLMVSWRQVRPSQHEIW